DSYFFMSCEFFFFFQAEDGIRDATVTGVQTCALPISLATGRGSRASSAWPRPGSAPRARSHAASGLWRPGGPALGLCPRAARARSEERRVGKESRARGAPDH